MTTLRPSTLAHIRGGALALAVAGVVSGCGGSSGTSTHTVTRATVAPKRAARSPKLRDYSFRTDALVTMRQYSPESLLWQSVSINAQGAAVLTTLIGEETGALRKDFQLPAGQAASLRRLVAGARTVRAPRPNDPHATLYTLHIAGEPAANLQGHTPAPLTALVTFLSNLMLHYCC